jgi:hypothetical protein
MAEEIAIPLEVDTSGLLESIQGVTKASKELGDEIKKALAGEVVTNALMRASQAMTGLAKDTTQAAAVITQGFFQAGPVGAAISGFGLLVGAVAADFGRVSAAAEAAAKKSREEFAKSAEVVARYRDELAKANNELRAIREASATGSSIESAASRLTLEDARADANSFGILAQDLNEQIAQLNSRRVRVEGAFLSGAMREQQLAEIDAQLAPLRAEVQRARSRETEARAQIVTLEAQAKVATERAAKEKADADKKARDDKAKSASDAIKPLTIFNAPSGIADAQRVFAEQMEIDAEQAFADREATTKAINDLRNEEIARINALSLAESERANIEGRAARARIKQIEEEKKAHEDLLATIADRGNADRALTEFAESAGSQALDTLAAAAGNAAAEVASLNREEAIAFFNGQNLAQNAQEFALTTAQAILAGIAQQAAGKAVLSIGEGLFESAKAAADTAIGNIPGATAHGIAASGFFTSAAQFGVIAGGAAIGGAALGLARAPGQPSGNALVQPNAGGFSGSGGGRGSRDAAPVVINIDGSSLLTEADIRRSVSRATYEADRRR